ncbi:MAG: 50S ribosomal protein L20 [Candidatus Levybacteria bacterium]|nr:50S ribosomal protein L20 [Candidatus Levybacteria bacterium]MDZ4227988.1 50S ribosomal protein L20 [Candidatus Levybacteria bacterium]
MAHIKRGVVSRRKHNKLLKLTKGYRGLRNKTTKQAHEAILHAGSYAFQGRKNKKRTFRALWNVRISEAVKQEGISYGVFINMLKKNNVELDRKILCNLVAEDPATFKKIVAEVKKV